MKINWLSRASQYSPYLLLCTSAQEYKDATASLDVDFPPPFINGDADATTHHFQRCGKCITIVCMDFYRMLDTTPRAVDGLLIHEAIHCADFAFDAIGEYSPSPEIYAYEVQAIAQELLMMKDQKLFEFKKIADPVQGPAIDVTHEVADTKTATPKPARAKQGKKRSSK